MQQDSNDKNSSKKLINLAILIMDELWGLFLMIGSTILIYILFRPDRQITGFVAGVSCGAIVWLILTRKHWLYPLAYSILIFAYLVTKRAVDVGIAGFYLSEWYGSVELMTLYSTIGTIILYKLTSWMEKQKKSFLLFKALSIILAVAVLFFAGVYGDSLRKEQEIFSTACNMMMEQLFIMRNSINELLAAEHIDMELAQQKLDFNLASTSLLVDSFLPENSAARRFDNYFRNQVKNFIFNYEEGVSSGAYQEDLSERERLEILRDYCSKLATDINATYGQLKDADKVLARAPEIFEEMIRP